MTHFYYKLKIDATVIGTPEVVEALKLIKAVATQHLKDLVMIFANNKGVNEYDTECITSE